MYDKHIGPTALDIFDKVPSQENTKYYYYCMDARDRIRKSPRLLLRLPHIEVELGRQLSRLISKCGEGGLILKNALSSFLK